MKKLLLISLLIAISATFSKSDAMDKVSSKPHYTIGTGSVGAAFYPVGKAICDLVNKNNLDFTCEAVSTGGSVYNLKSIQSGTHDFGVSQSVAQIKSYNGEDVFEEVGANKNLRTVTPLHTEIMLLAVSENSNINSFSDLRGKKVNLGNEGSGTRNILNKLLEHKKIDEDYFAEITDLKSGDLPKAFCENKIDAAIYSTAHPNKIYTELTEKCGVKIIDLWDSEIQAFVENSDDYKKAKLPANIYQNQNEEVKAFGIPVILSASNKIPKNHIEQMSELVKSKKPELEKVNPVFKTIDFERLENIELAPYF